MARIVRGVSLIRGLGYAYHEHNVLGQNDDVFSVACYRIAPVVVVDDVRRHKRYVCVERQRREPFDVPALVDGPHLQRMMEVWSASDELDGVVDYATLCSAHSGAGSPEGA